MKSTWRHYIPALFCFLLAFIFLIFPILAAILAITILVAIGGLYSYFVARIHRGLRSARHQTMPTDWSHEEPSFRNVSVYVVNHSKWLNEVR